MDLFKEVRERADILQVCDILGIKLDRSYKCICPFSSHKEKTASFSIHPGKNIFCCFGCGKKGNSITLVQELLNISALEAAKYINYHLKLGIDAERPTSHLETNRYKQRRKTNESFKKWVENTLKILIDYLHLLWRWKELKDPQNDLYVEALHQEQYIEYIIDDIFLNGTNEDKIWFWKNETSFIQKIKDKVSTLKIK